MNKLNLSWLRNQVETTMEVLVDDDDHQWWSWWSSLCVGAWFGNLVLVKMMMIDVRELDEREREREVCVMLLLTHYFVQWCISFTSSLLQTIGIHGMHMPLVCQRT
jgi:hypothetical protein